MKKKFNYFGFYQIIFTFVQTIKILFMKNYEDLLKAKISECADLVTQLEQKKVEINKMVESMKADLSQSLNLKLNKLFVSQRKDFIEVLEEQIRHLSSNCFCETFEATDFHEYEFSVSYGVELNLESIRTNVEDYFDNYLPTSLFDEDDIESITNDNKSLIPIFANKELIDEITTYLVKKMRDIDFSNVNFDDFEEFEANLHGTELTLIQATISCDDMKDFFNSNLDYDYDSITEIINKYFVIVEDEN